MKVASVRSALVLCLVAAQPGAADVGEVSRAELQRVVERDGVPFIGGTLPEPLLERLARHPVVIIGETHQLREHYQFMSALMRALQPRGFRQLLLEWPHALDWLLADFVASGGLEPTWQPATLLGGEMIEAVRVLNTSLPAAERLRVRAIDVNLVEYEARLFAKSMRELAKHLTDPPLEAFFRADATDPEAQRKWLEGFRSELADRREELIASWGAASYRQVHEMVEVELASVGINASRDIYYDLSVRFRENVMKQLADKRLDEIGRTVVHVGGNHAQKQRLKGTEQQWLGDYLVHESRVTEGAVFVIVVTPARGAPGSVGGIAEFDILDASPPNELFRVVNETWPDEVVYLPMDDPMFSAGGVPMNFEDTVHVCAPKRHYDALVLLPWAHHVHSP